MKSRPILFSGEMVLAILDGRKTQTRRVLKPMAGQQSGWLTEDLLNRVPEVRVTETSTKGGPRDPGVQLTHPYGGPLGWIRSPYGGAGDQLWVRETFFDTNAAIGDPRFGAAPRYIYRADFDYREKDRSIIGAHHWKPSIFCTRAASRITLEITDVHVERLNAISEEDAKAEGCRCAFLPQSEVTSFRRGYSYLWERINGAGSWASNPYVWAITFKRITP